MPSKKPSPKAPEPAPPWQLILEEMRSQNRATIEAVEASRTTLERELHQMREQTNARLEVLEAGVRQNGTDTRHLQGDVKQLQSEVRGLAGKLERVAHLEERVGALERRRG